MNDFFIAYFPYISLKEIPEIDLGFAKIWNFDLKKNDYIKDPKLLEKVEKIMNINVELWSGSIKNVGVISIGPVDFRKYTEEENEIIREVRHILFISFIAKNNTVKPGANAGVFMATAENFDVIYQNFSLDGENFSEQTGEIININAAGYNFINTKFQKPRYINKPFRFDLDKEIFDGLLKLRVNNPLVFRRCLNAIQIYMESYYNTPYLSRNARILLNVSAFEILLSLPETQQRKIFKEKIKKLVSLKGEQEHSYWTKIGAKSRKLKGTIAEIWVDKFYTLRSDIIHGNNVLPKDFVFKNCQHHLDISCLFFVFLLRKQLEKNLDNDYLCNYKIEWNKWTEDFPVAREMQGFVCFKSYRKLFKRLLRQKFVK